MARSAPARCSKVVSMVQPCCVRKGRFSVAKRAGSVQPTRRYANPLLGVEMWRTRYLNDAVSLATSTAVRLPLQKAVCHNPSALFCVRNTLSCGWCEVCARAASVRRDSHAKRIPQRLLPVSLLGAQQHVPGSVRRIDRVLVYENFIALALLTANSLVAGFFAYIYSLKRQAYLLLWTAGWTLFALHYLGPALAQWVPATPLQTALDRWLYAVAAIFFFLGAQLYSQRKPWKVAAGVTAVVLGAWAVANALRLFSVIVVVPAALLFAAVAIVFWQESKRQETLADRLLGLSFASWTVLQLAIFFFFRSAPAELGIDSPLTAVPSAFVAMLMVMASYEEEKRRIERNMLALSNLNLATSSFVGGEIQRMLAQALDRVLGVVRLPAGALFLHHGDPQGPTSVVAAGLSEEFCRVAQNENLDDYLVSLVARLGGLLGFRDLRDDSLSALEKEQSIRRFRQLALAHGLRSVVAISLQAKEQAFGVLLLGTPDSRRFTAAELRLLLALGHQIGMAVENSYLIQQTARRTQELNLLNEIGRALSSTLDPETLFETILTEMRRLFDFNEFCITLHDPVRNEIRFEVEVREGKLLPKRSRPLDDRHVTEYLMRTRQPLLIRENFAEEMRKLGLETHSNDEGCFCGVPLLLYERPIGTMVVQSSQERALDTRHLEMMRVLASEAVIALENSRLFREERT